jgi:hypothetical protein
MLRRKEGAVDGLRGSGASKGEDNANAMGRIRNSAFQFP